MKRIDILYDGEHYSVGGREFADVKQEIADGLSAGRYWLPVNEGEGAARPAYLLLTPGVPLALIPITADVSDDALVEDDDVPIINDLPFPL